MYYISHAGGGSYGAGHSFKIYEIEDNKVVKSVAGVYFSLRKGTDIDDTHKDEYEKITNTYNEAVSLIFRSCVDIIFNGQEIYKQDELIYKLVKKLNKQ